MADTSTADTNGKKKRGRPPKAASEAVKAEVEDLHKRTKDIGAPKRKPIPVKKLTFNVHRPFAGPGGQKGSTTVKAREDDRPGYDIDYRPWMRAFRVGVWKSKDGPEVVGYVFENETVWVEFVEGVEP